MTRASDHETLKAITDYIDDFGYPPTVRGLGELLGLSSPSSVHRRLESLIESGQIERVGPHKLISVKRRDEWK